MSHTEPQIPYRCWNCECEFRFDQSKLAICPDCGAEMGLDFGEICLMGGLGFVMYGLIAGTIYWLLGWMLDWSVGFLEACFTVGLGVGVVLGGAMFGVGLSTTRKTRNDPATHEKGAQVKRARAEAKAKAEAELEAKKIAMRKEILAGWSPLPMVGPMPAEFAETARPKLPPGLTRVPLRNQVEFADRGAFGRDGERFVTVGPGSHSLIFDAASGQTLRVLKPPSYVYAVAYSPIGDTVLCGGARSDVTWWDLNGRQLAAVTGNEYADDAGAVCFLGDGKSAVSAHRSHLVLWDLKAEMELRHLPDHEEMVHALCASPTAYYQVASGAADKTVRLWDTASGMCFQVLRGHTDEVLSVCYSRDGGWLLSGSKDKTLRLWDTVSGESLRTFAGHDAAVHSVAISVDRQVLASADKAGGVRVWDATTGQCVNAFEGDSSAKFVCFAPDGTLLWSDCREIVHLRAEGPTAEDWKRVRL